MIRERKKDQLPEKMLPSLYTLGRQASVAFFTKSKVKVLAWQSIKVAQHSPPNLGAFTEVILQEWNRIDVTVCCELVHSRPKRISAVLESNGGHAKYQIMSHLLSVTDFA
uniref:Uncharacterized protein n=1 Tax=Stegastes partitus TaxID=144197 RepID=A0A3B5AKQ8_9TELE